MEMITKEAMGQNRDDHSISVIKDILGKDVPLYCNLELDASISHLKHGLKLTVYVAIIDLLVGNFP